jgi:DNA-binding CsgD family transcriptional regulator
MAEIPEKRRGAALAFALDLAQEGENFPKKALSLLDRHFGFRRSVFFPHGAGGGSTAARRGALLSNYVTYGVTYGTMYDYKDHLYREDIFALSKLPAGLRGRRVIFPRDIMPQEEYLQTAFARHLAEADLPHQVCLYLYHGGRLAASVALLRTEEEGGFDGDDRALLEYLTQLMELSYQNVLRLSGEARFLDAFHLFFGELPLGAVLLHQDLTVMQANPAARDLGRVFWEQFRAGQGNFLRSNYQGEEQFREVQTMVNEISEKLTAPPRQGVSLVSIAGEMCFYHATMLLSGVTGAVQTWHILLITNKNKELPQNLGHPYGSLTQQERRIAYYLSTGMKNEQIAAELHISIYTVRTHIANIYKKFEVGNKVDLLMQLTLGDS